MDNRAARSKNEPLYEWPRPTNVSDPVHIVTDFDGDDGIFTEENGTHNRVIENGNAMLKCDKNGGLMYVHVYESNVTLKSRFKYTDAAPTGSMLFFMLRYNSEHAYVRLSYHFFSKAWAIMGSEGFDQPLFRYVETKDAPIEPDTWHDIEFTVDGNTSKAYLDGKLILTADDIDHLSPGRIAMGAQNMTLVADNADIALLSGQGTLMKYITHNKVLGDESREGGTVLEMRDGTLKYLHKSGDTLDSKDNGKTWQRAEKWTDPQGYPNILRLKNGDFIKLVNREVNGLKYKACQTSSDDGATWVDGGIICQNPYKGNTTATALNMNDKVTQISSGRIFYAQNYEHRPWSTALDGRIVFCEFYYSDDNGATWTKSETDSWTFGGKDDNNVQFFGECKILECDDGTLRIYNSWNDYGCMVWSESKDGGVTWSELYKMPEFVCARSSMQFCRDTYADNETTYYMVWVYSPMIENHKPMTRSRLSLARSFDGKNWEYLGDLWRWEHRHRISSHLAHVVDPFVMTNETHLICGSGFCEHAEIMRKDGYHHAQRQHIYSIAKKDLKATELTPV